MKLRILQKRVLESSTWYMCVGNLYDYLSTLKKDFYEYQIQRRIVRNVYLDNVYTSIVSGEPLPPITLNYKEDLIGEVYSDIDVDMGACNVLDGLQRTFRMWIILELKKIIDELGFQNYKSLRTWLRQDIERGAIIGAQEFVNTNFLKMLFTDNGIDTIIESYKKYDITLSIWCGLNDDDVVRKMLVLNAGQRAVSSTHQYELLFLHFFDDEKLNFDNVRLVREKDRDYFKIRAGKRNIGEYPLSSIIVAIQSLIDKKPYRVTPANFISLDQESEKEGNDILFFFKTDYLRSFIQKVRAMDEALSKVDDRYIAWFGKDTTLSGIFAAIGNSTEDNDKVLETIDTLIERINNKDIDFNINNFNLEYSQLSSVKVNLGNEVRYAIFTASSLLLTGQKVADWYDAFKKGKKV